MYVALAFNLLHGFGSILSLLDEIAHLNAKGGGGGGEVLHVSGTIFQAGRQWQKSTQT